MFAQIFVSSFQSQRDGKTSSERRERKGRWEVGRAREREALIYLFTTQLLQMVKTGPRPELEFQSKSSSPRTQILELSPLPFRIGIGRQLEFSKSMILLNVNNVICNRTLLTTLIAVRRNVHLCILRVFFQPIVL